MKVLVVLCLIAFASAAPAERSKRAPDDDDFYLLRAVSNVGVRRTVSPARTFVRQRRPVFYYDDDRFDFDRKKRSADFDFDFDFDDDVRFYRPVSSVRRTVGATAGRTRTSVGTAVRPQVYYYDDDLFDHDRKKRSADLDDDDFRWFIPRFSAPTTYAAQTRTAQPAAGRPVATRYVYLDDDLFDHDRKKRSADFDDDDDDNYRFAMFSQPSYTSVTQARTSVGQAPTYYYFYDDDK